jgi:DNA-binding GntR family transcriptional regulator
MGTKREAFEWRLAATRSNAELAYDRLRQAIVDGQFEPGQRLTEVGIAAMLGVSRTPVRESFLRLEADGLLRSGPGGVEVVDPRGEATEIFLLREAVEGCAARLAAEHATAAEIAGIKDLAARTDKVDPRQLKIRATLNEQFHLAIAAAAHAPRVERLIREYRSLFATAEQLGRVAEPKTRRLLSEHAGIADAIAKRLPDLAEERMRTHLRAFQPFASR